MPFQNAYVCVRVAVPRRGGDCVENTRSAVDECDPKNPLCHQNILL